MCKIVLIYSTNGAHKVYCKFANFLEKNPFRTFLYVYIEKDFFLVLEIKGVFF